MPHRVLLVEDDASIRELTQMGLERVGFEVVTSVDGASALHDFDSYAPDVVVLDLMLPEVDGLDVCRAIRSRSTTPVVMLTARGDVVDIVVGLEAGADDYLTKPFELPELVARIRAVLWRGSAAGESEPSAIRLGPLRIDLQAHLVERDGEEIPLTPIEFGLLQELALRPRQAFTREMLLERVWGYDYLGDSRLVDVAVQRLRAKIEPDPSSPSLVLTIRGVGYRAGWFD